MRQYYSGDVTFNKEYISNNFPAQRQRLSRLARLVPNSLFQYHS